MSVEDLWCQPLLALVPPGDLDAAVSSFEAYRSLGRPIDCGLAERSALDFPQRHHIWLAVLLFTVPGDEVPLLLAGDLIVWCREVLGDLRPRGRLLVPSQWLRDIMAYRLEAGV